MLLGVIGFSLSHDPSMLQGGLTLGGGWIICALFSMTAGSRWVGVAGAGVLGLLGASRCIPAFFKLPKDSANPQLIFQAIAGALCVLVTVVVVRLFFQERNRRQIEALKAGD